MFKRHQFSVNPGIPINTFILPFVFTDKVEEAVESIWRCHFPSFHRLILIDNSNEDFEARKRLEEKSHFCIKSYRNLGPAVAFNLGIEMARTEYVTIISDDARLIHDLWFTRTSRLLEDSKDTVVSLGSIYPQRCDEGDFYEPNKIYTDQDYSNYCKKYEMRRDGFSLACATALKETWIKSGLFDESKYIYWIDGTFADQAVKKGISCVMNGVVFHYGDASHKGRLVEEDKYDDTGIQGGVVIL